MARLWAATLSVVRLTALLAKPSGSYAIHQGTLDLGSNYNLTFVSNNFSITQRDLTVQSHGVNKQYDATTAATVTLSENGCLLTR